ncbi:SUMO-conjugating enzyme UBC9 [Bienertia sinuspersici]
MRRLKDKGKEMEKKIDQSEYEEEEWDSKEPDIQSEAQPQASKKAVSFHPVQEVSLPLKVQVAPRGSPLVKSMLDEPMGKLKMPVCRYDGTMDLVDHVLAYKGHMMLYTMTDSVWCKVFRITLIGIAQNRFKSIPPRYISDWRVLSRRFTTHFVSNKRRHKISSELLAPRKKEGEGLLV